MHLYRWLLISMVGLVLSLYTVPSHAAPSSQPAPQLAESDWLVVVYARSSDSLHWVNEQGEQISIPRPKLPNESPDAYPQYQFSRDGRYVAIAADLTDGSVGLGFYDVQAGQFTVTHKTQVGESIVLGGRYNTNPASTRMAVGFTYPFAGEGNQLQTSWRVIIFELASGAVLDELRSDEAEIANFVGGEFLSEGLISPAPVYYEEDATQDNKEAIHIQFVPWGDPPLQVPTLAWYPQGTAGLAQEIYASPFNMLGIDILPTTKQAVFPHVDDNQPNLAGVGIETQYNAIARGTPSTQGGFVGPTILYTDGTKYFYGPTWGASGDMVAFATGDSNHIITWQVMNLSTISLSPLPNNIDNIIGLPQGVVYITNDGLVAAQSLNGPLNLWQAPADSELAWGLVAGAPLGFSSVAQTGTVVAPPSVSCAGVLPSQIGVGDNARVTFTDGRPLNVRSAANGTVLTQLAEGTGFEVIGGGVCAENGVWWQIRLADGREGWVVEGDAQSYYIEPLDVDAAGRG